MSGRMMPDLRNIKVGWALPTINNSRMNYAERFFIGYELAARLLNLLFDGTSHHAPQEQ